METSEVIGRQAWPKTFTPRNKAGASRLPMTGLAARRSATAFRPDLGRRCGTCRDGRIVFAASGRHGRAAPRNAARPRGPPADVRGGPARSPELSRFAANWSSRWFRLRQNSGMPRALPAVSQETCSGGICPPFASRNHQGSGFPRPGMVLRSRFRVGCPIRANNYPGLPPPGSSPPLESHGAHPPRIRARYSPAPGRRTGFFRDVAAPRT